MSKHGRNQPVKAVQARKGEGIPLQIKFGPNVTVRGVVAKSFGVDLSKAPVPERKYLAKVCSVGRTEAAVTFMFGQPQIGAKKLRNLLVVEMNAAGAVALLDSMNQLGPIFEQTAQLGFRPEISPPVTEEPMQVVELAANFALCAISGYEACLDFFEASPFSLAIALQTETLYLDPVVRVNIRTPLLLGLVDELRKIAGTLQLGSAQGAMP
jgi:hypothetical protein